MHCSRAESARARSWPRSAIRRRRARGELFTDSGDLHRLIGRATTPLRDAVREALSGTEAG